jgi:hypothetical protein
MDKILINIDSRQRNINAYPDPCFFKIGNESESPSNFNNYINFKNIDYITLSSIEIPNNFYVFTSKRDNTFLFINCIQENDNVKTYNNNSKYVYPLDQNINAGSSYVYINEGNYDLDILVNALNIQLNLYSYNYGYYEQNSPLFMVIDGLKCVYNSVTSKISFINLSNQFSFNINFDNNNNNYVSLGYLLGYRKLSYTVKLQDTIIPEAISDTDAEKYIFIRINDFGNIYLNHKVPKKALGKIVLTMYKQSFLFNNNADILLKQFKFRQPVNINILEIELLDYNGNRLDNNGSDYSLTLELGQIYDEKLYNIKLNNLLLNTDNNITNELIYDLNNQKEYSIDTKELKKKKKKKNYGFNYNNF